MLNPIVWVFALLLAAYFCRNARTMKKLLLYAILVFWFFSNSFIVDEVMRPWEIRTSYKNIRDKKYKYGIVLGGIMNGYVYATGQIIFNRSVDRLMQANARAILKPLDAGEVEGARATAKRLAPLGTAR